MKLPETYREQNQSHDESDDEFMLDDMAVIVNTHGETQLAHDLDRRTTDEFTRVTRHKSGTKTRQPERLHGDKHLHEKSAETALRKAVSSHDAVIHHTSTAKQAATMDIDQEIESLPPRPSYKQLALSTQIKPGERVDLDIANEDLGLKIEQALASPYGPQWREAAEAETQSLIDLKTWEITSLDQVTPERTLVDNKWVFKVKINDKQELDKFKARLCARGFTEIEGQDYKETFAPVARLSTFRLVLALSAGEGWYHTHIDIKTAFLNSTLKEPIYMVMPKFVFEYYQSKYGMFEGKTYEQANVALKLIKSIYGLKQAGRDWYKTIDPYILSLDFKRCVHDPCAYVKGNRLDKVIIVLFVDDMLIAAKRMEDLFRIKRQIAEEFKMSAQDLSQYLGIQVSIDQSRHNIGITSEQYTRKMLIKYDIPVNPTVTTPMLSSDKKKLKARQSDEPAADLNLYRSAACSVMYNIQTTRLDAAYAANVCARYLSQPGQTHLDAIVRCLQYLGNTADKQINYSIPSDPMLLHQLYAYTDASHQDHPETQKTTSGYILYLNGGPISWRVKLSTRVYKSPSHSEYNALFETVNEIRALRNLMTELGFEPHRATTIYEDNTAVISVGNNPKAYDRMKGVETNEHIIREAVERGEILLQHVRSQDNVADMMTKPLAEATHSKHTNAVLQQRPRARKF
jgi:hypothetical protein